MGVAYCIWPKITNITVVYENILRNLQIRLRQTGGIVLSRYAAVQHSLFIRIKPSIPATHLVKWIVFFRNSVVASISLRRKNLLLINLKVFECWNLPLTRNYQLLHFEPI